MNKLIKGILAAAIVLAAGVAGAGESNAVPSPEAVARVIVAQIQACRDQGASTTYELPEGVWIYVSNRPISSQNAASGALGGRGKVKGWVWGVSGLGAALAATDRVAANNDWLWHRGRDDWAGIAREPGSTKSSGSQTTDGGGDNYYSEGDMTVYNQNGERREDSDNE